MAPSSWRPRDASSRSAAALAAAHDVTDPANQLAVVDEEAEAHRRQVSTADITEDLRAQHGARPEGAWRTGDWVQIHLGAREFGSLGRSSCAE